MYEFADVYIIAVQSVNKLVFTKENGDSTSKMEEFYQHLSFFATPGCFMAGSRGPTSFARLVIEASVVSDDQWNQVPTIQQVKISQAMSKNLKDLLMFGD